MKGMKRRSVGNLVWGLLLLTVSSHGATGAEYAGCDEGETVLADDADVTAVKEIGKLTEEQVKDFVARQAALGTCGTWYSNIALGAQFLPDYSEEGRSSGFSEQRFFGQIRIDGRWGKWNAGFLVAFRGTPVTREAPGTVPTEFKDISDALITGPYLSRSLWEFNEADVSRKIRKAQSGAVTPDPNGAFPPDKVKLSVVGALARVSAISREQLDENKDSVDSSVSLGLFYSYNDFRRLGYRNGLPRFYANASAAWFENYADIGSENRAVVDAAMRVFDAMPIYVGVSGNFGSGPDELALYVAYTFKAQKFVDFF